MAKKEIHEEHENHERWLVSYADMITLLAALFIVLFAMSSIDLAKFQKFAKSLSSDLGGSSSAGALDNGGGQNAVKGSSGNLDGTAGATTAVSAKELQAAKDAVAAENAQATSADQARMSSTGTALKQALQDAGLSDQVSIRQESRGLVITVLTDGVLFDSGSSSIPPAGVELLSLLAPKLTALPNQIGIEGHTDDQPTGGGTSNWELSTNRATSVLRVLVEQFGLPADRVYAAGFADQRPIAPNDTAAHRALNRRVEIVVLAQSTGSTASATDTAGTTDATQISSGIDLPTNPIGTPVDATSAAG
ncbi:MAG: flagellar motor protein MotB [Acidimicrobiia bacterium]